MAGYLADYSMSVNAQDAYESGEKPYSKWTKESILESINDICPEKYEMLKKVKLDILKENLLYKSSWHHTSKFYNKTDFYSVDEEELEDLTPEIIEQWKRSYVKKTPTKIVRKKGDIHFWEWEKLSRKKFKMRYFSYYDVLIEEHGQIYFVYDNENNLIVRKKSNSDKVGVAYDMSENNKAVRKITIYDEENKPHEYSINYKVIYKNMTKKATAFFKSINKNYEVSNKGYMYRNGYFLYDWSPEMGTMRLKPIVKNKSIISFELEYYYDKNFITEGEFEDKNISDRFKNIYNLYIA